MLLVTTPIALVPFGASWIVCLARLVGFCKSTGLTCLMAAVYEGRAQVAFNDHPEVQNQTNPTLKSCCHNICAAHASYFLIFVSVHLSSECTAA